jgi:hypothetical protein
MSLVSCLTMKAISRRLTKLEKVFAPAVEVEDGWGSMVEVRDRLLQLAEETDPLSVAAFTEELEHLGPLGLWRETARGYLSDHGFVQSESESFAETMARALGIDTDELRVCIAENRIGSALLERFREPIIAADNEKHSIGSARANRSSGTRITVGVSTADRMH